MMSWLKFLWEESKYETRVLWSLSWRVSLTFFASYSLNVVNALFAGRLGTLQLAGLGLGSLMCNVTGLSVAVGLLGAMDTLCPQAYGAKQYPVVGFVAQRAVLICTLALIPIILLWIFVEDILLALGQEPVPSKYAAVYARTLCFGIPAFMCFEAMKRFLQAQAVVNPMLYVVGVAAVLHPLWCWLLSANFGFIGIPISTCITFWTMALLLLFYILLRRPHRPETWPGFNGLEARSCWGEYLKLALPAMAMLCLPWWAFEVLALGAGSISTVALASHTILATIDPLAFMLPLGSLRQRGA